MNRERHSPEFERNFDSHTLIEAQIHEVDRDFRRGRAGSGRLLKS